MYKSFQPSKHEIHRTVFYIVSGTKMRENKNLHVTHAVEDECFGTIKPLTVDLKHCVR